MAYTQTPLTQETADALVRLIEYIPSCAAIAESGIRVTAGFPDEDVWWIDAGSDAHECGWHIEAVEDGLRFIHEHYSLVADKQRQQEDR